MSVLVFQCSQHSFFLCHRLIGSISMTYSQLSSVFFSNELFFVFYRYIRCFVCLLLFLLLFVSYYLKKRISLAAGTMALCSHIDQLLLFLL